MNRYPDNSDDIIDSRDVIKAIDELEQFIENADPDEDWGDERDQLDSLRALRDEGEGSADWSYGETLIRDTYFKDYAMQLAEDIDAIPSDARWPLTCIDWNQAASELQMDYTSIDFDGVTYWIRS